MTSPAASAPADGPGPLRHTGVVLPDGVEELDAVGPWEVLASWTQQHPAGADRAREVRRQVQYDPQPPV